ncbi:hypothetical protein QYF61_026280 [Mycteria americana]|uniref:Core shell protein Gag P30 domain-containing protein n=1 Tax=Mycteria americana TaxID=33587 RepID=A0AAN7NMZ3_MYCAM|nr:hypothetical protein QYF61_026280 [Mycteria americana]
MGAAASQEAALCSPLGCILKHCNKPGGDAMTKNQLKRYRNQGWPQYQWEEGEKWPENGSLKYNTVSELTLCCRGTEKWDEMPSVDMCFSLRRDWDIRKKGGLVDSKHRIGIYVLKEKKGKPRCIEWENSEEDIQLSGDKETPSAFSERLCEVARKWTDLDPEDDSNSKLFNRLFIGQAAADIRKR